MPKFGPIKRPDLIYFLKRCGFIGPIHGTKHQVMINGIISVRIPNPHRGDISIDLLNRILKQAGISKQDWEKL